MSLLDVVAIGAIITAFIAAPFLLFYGIPFLTSRGNGTSSKIGGASICLFVISVVVGLGAGETSKEIAHGRVVSALESLRDDCRISINGKGVSNSKDVLSVLKTLDWLPAHHSNPTKRINIEISDHALRLVLSLARDSGDPREYWVFYPKYRVTSYNEIGRIKTPLFDAY